MADSGERVPTLEERWRVAAEEEDLERDFLHPVLLVFWEEMLIQCHHLIRRVAHPFGDHVHGSPRSGANRSKRVA